MIAPRRALMERSRVEKEIFSDELRDLSQNFPKNLFTKDKSSGIKQGIMTDNSFRGVVS